MGEPLDPNQQGYEPWPVHGPPPGPSPYDQPQYGPPLYDPQYGPPRYATPDRFGRPHAYPPAPPAPTPLSASNRTRLWLIGSAAVTVIAAVALVLTFVVFDGGSGSRAATHKIKLPTALDGYSRVESDVAQQVADRIRNAGAGNAQVKQIYDAASIGVYAHNTGDQPGLVAVVLPTGDFPDHDNLSYDEIATTLLRGAVPSADVQTVSNGAHDGSADCGSTYLGAADETICSWSDHKTTGLVVAVAPALSILALSAVENDLRDAVE